MPDEHLFRESDSEQRTLDWYSVKNRPIENEDVVVWHSFGHTHVCKPEDFPVMPVEYAGFMLKPNGFFAENPAMDLPPERNSASKDDRNSETCCP